MIDLYHELSTIAEHRGKEGGAKKWGSPVTINIIDDLVEDIYAILSYEIPRFDDLSKDKKSHQACGMVSR